MMPKKLDRMEGSKEALEAEGHRRETLFTWVET